MCLNQEPKQNSGLSLHTAHFEGTVIVLLSLLVWVSCDRSLSDQQSDGGINELDIAPHDIIQSIDQHFDASLVLEQITVVENPTNSLSYFLFWQTGIASVGEIKLICDGEEIGVAMEETYQTDHEVFIMGLIPGVSCEISIQAVGENDLEGGAIVHLSEVYVPAELDEFSVETFNPENTQPGWTLFGLTSVDFPGNQSPVYLVLVDEMGRYRWLYERTSTGTGTGASDVNVFDGGLLTAGPSPANPAQISWLGEILWEGDFIMHHDIQSSPYLENGLLYLGYGDSSSCVGCDGEGSVVDYDLSTQEASFTWCVCDHYIPLNNENGWSHLNDIEPVEGEDRFLLSSREQSAILNVNRTTGDLVWILGGDYNEFEMAPEALFYRQHAPHAQPGGSILLFDNGMDGVREYSRAVEIALHFDDSGGPLSAEVAWEYVDESLYSGARSEADRLSNGNTLITYSLLDQEDVSLLREVTAEGEPVWELRTEPSWNIYRSERILQPELILLTP
jgi:hypothetical protein